VLDRNTLSVKITGRSHRVLEIGIGPERAPTMSILPATATLGVSATQQFSATFTGTDNTAVRWSVDSGPEAPSEAAGQIDKSGRYTAPGQIDRPYTVIVTATRDTDTASSASATINLLPSVRVWMEPANVDLEQSESRQFVATVYGTSNTAVTWSLDSPIGTLSASGLYTPPKRVEVPQKVNVRATSQADRSKSAYAQVVVLPPGFPKSTGGCRE